LTIEALVLSVNRNSYDLQILREMMVVDGQEANCYLAKQGRLYILHIFGHVWLCLVE